MDGGASHDHVDVIDRDDNVVGTVTRAEIRAGNLRHRAVYVVVRTTAGEVVVHKRAEWKDVYPGAWDCCFGGVVDAGEDWDHAARRELREEVGIDAEVRFVAHGRYEEADGRVVGRVYECTHDGPYPCPDGEVVALAKVPADGLAAFLAGRDHCPDSARFVLGAG